MRNEAEVLEKLQSILSSIEGTLNKQQDFRVQTTAAEGISYTFDRENYLQLGMEIVSEEIQFLIDDIQERAEKKSNLSLVKK